MVWGVLKSSSVITSLSSLDLFCGAGQYAVWNTSRPKTTVSYNRPVTRFCCSASTRMPQDRFGRWGASTDSGSPATSSRSTVRRLLTSTGSCFLRMLKPSPRQRVAASQVLSAAVVNVNHEYPESGALYANANCPRDFQKMSLTIHQACHLKRKILFFRGWA